MTDTNDKPKADDKPKGKANEGKPRETRAERQARLREQNGPPAARGRYR